VSPPRSNLVLRLRCRRLPRRLRTRTLLVVARIGGAVTLYAQVIARRPVTGDVTFFAGGRVIGTVALGRRMRIASIGAYVRGHPRLSATFDGSATLAPSRSARAIPLSTRGRAHRHRGRRHPRKARR
jgi:hypothetical protein